MEKKMIEDELEMLEDYIYDGITTLREKLVSRIEQKSKKTEEMSEINIELVLREIAERMERDMRHVARLIDAKYHRGNKNV